MVGGKHILTCLGDEPRADQFAEENREIWGQRMHPVLQVVVQLGTVVGHFDDLIAELLH